MTDRGSKPERVEEELVRDGNRLIAVANGKPYATWLIREDGIWRADPKNGAALLRYLPPLVSEGYRKQQSGDTEVWFGLQRKEACQPYAPDSPLPDACWVLTVLNRGEKIRFEFGHELGLIRAVAEHYRQPSLSFTKRLLEHGQSELDRAERERLIASFPLTGAREAAVLPVSAAQFTAARTEIEMGAALAAVEMTLQALRTGTLHELVNPESGVAFGPYGHRGAPEIRVTGKTLQAALDAMTSGATPELVGVNLTPSRVDLALHGLTPTEVPVGIEIVRVEGLVMLTLSQYGNGSWRLWLAGPGGSLLEREIEHGQFGWRRP